MTKAKRIILIFALCILAAAASAAGVFAYFSRASAKTETISTEIAEDGEKAFVAEVNDFDGLYRATKSEYYNDKNILSVIEENDVDRKIVRLGGNITLNNDLYVTADVHIDLNGKMLALNGHTLFVQHGYAGVFSIYNGTMSVNNGEVVIDTPNAYTEIGNGVIADGNAVHILSSDFGYTAYAAVYEVAKGLSSDLEKRPARLSYTKYSAKTANELADPGVYLATKTHNETSEACAYLAKGKAIALPSHFLATGYALSYSSRDPNVLTNGGEPVAAGNTILTVTAAHGNDAFSVNFSVHVVEQGTTEIAETLLRSYLSAYLNSNGAYEFSAGVELPTKDDDLGISLEYKPDVEMTSYPKESVYVFEPNKNCKKLTVTVKVNGNENGEFTLDIYSNYVAQNETVAWLILDRWYGGSVVYDSTLESTKLYMLDDLKTNEDLNSYIADYQITDISYALTEAAQAYYSIDSNGELRMHYGATPLKAVTGIECTFTFGSDAAAKTVTVELSILYVTGSEGTASSFLMYYNNYNGQVPLETSETFTMPFQYGGGAPFTVYEFSYNYTVAADGVYTITRNGAPAAISMVLKGSDEKTLFSTEDTSNVVESFNTWLAGDGKTYTLKTLAEAGAKWEITVEPTKMTDKDVPVVMLYRYTFASPAEGRQPNWNPYQTNVNASVDGAQAEYKYTESSVSSFVLKGGVFLDENNSADNAVNDEALFNWMLKTYGIETGKTFIELDDLKRNAVLDVTTDEDLKKVTTWKGVKYLTGVTQAILSGATNIDITHLDSMTELQKLDLSDCRLNETDLQKLTHLDKLRELNVSSNSVLSFDWLTIKNFPALQKVYVYGNTSNNEYQGSEGMSNFQTFEDLARAGVSVYNTLNSNKVPMLFAESTERNDYRRLKSLVYQSSIAAGADITSVYKGFETLTTTLLKMTENRYSENKITWAYGGGTNEYDATWFSATVKTTGGITMTVKFYVDRYSNEKTE